MFDSYYSLVTNTSTPLLLRYTIAEKLGTTNLDGAPSLIDDLIAFLEEGGEDADAETLLDVLYSGQN